MIFFEKVDFEKTHTKNNNSRRQKKNIENYQEGKELILTTSRLSFSLLDKILEIQLLEVTVVMGNDVYSDELSFSYQGLHCLTLFFLGCKAYTRVQNSI